MDRLSLSLQPRPQVDIEAKSLRSIIPRIGNQRGHLRNITEDSLRQEIDAAESGCTEDAVLDDTDVPDQTVKDESKDVLAARELIVRQVAQAYDEAYRALDFVSLLLSKETPRQAEISMSPYLRSHIPLGSLGTDQFQRPPISEQKRSDDHCVTRGWMLQGLQSAADSLLSSATRLEREIQTETRYWEQVLAIDKKGWSVCKLPQEKHTLAVRFGFPEATGTFQDRGLAALRPSEDGKIILDQGITSAEPRSIRVRIVGLDQIVTGTSTIPPLTGADTIEDVIQQARASIYEEEIFHELGREAQSLVNQGVQLDESTLSVILPDKKLLVDLIPLKTEPRRPATTGDDQLADGILLAFRILLSYTHRQNLRARSQPPAPLTEKPQPFPAYHLLRPVLTHLHHEYALLILRRLLTLLQGSLGGADLRLAHKFNVVKSAAVCSTSRPITDSIVEAFLECTETTVDILLPGYVKVHIHISTHIRPPHFGTVYVVDSRSGNESASAPSDKAVFHSAAELEVYIKHLVVLALVTEVANYSSLPFPSVDRSTESGRKTYSDIEALHGWKPAAQFDELERRDTSEEGGQVRRISFEVQTHGVAVKCTQQNFRASNGKADPPLELLYPCKPRKEALPSLKDIVKTAASSL